MAANLSNLLSACATLTSLNLVFLGFIITAFQQNPSTSEGMGRNRYRSLAVFSLAAFAIGLVCVAACSVGLLLSPVPGGLFWSAVGVFFLQLSSLLALSVYAVFTIL